MKPTQKLLARILLGSIFPRSGSSDQLSWDHRYFIYYLTKGYQLNWAKYIFNHLCKAVNAIQRQTKPNVHIIYPRILSEIFYQCGVIDVIKAAGQDNLLRELRASIISVHTLSNMYFLPGQFLKLSEPLEQQPHSEESMIKRLNIDIASVAQGIVNQYIQLLESQGEPFEIESEEVKGKRKRLVRTRVESEKGENKGKAKIKVVKTNVAVLEDEDDDDEPLRIKKSKISKELKKKKNIESSTIINSGTLTDPKGPVVLTHETQNPPTSNKPSESPLEFLEQHLAGELSPQSKPLPSDNVQNSDTIPDFEQNQNLTSNLDQIIPETNPSSKLQTQPNVPSEPEHAQPQLEPYSSPEHVHIQSEPQPSPEQQTQLDHQTQPEPQVEVEQQTSTHTEVIATDSHESVHTEVLI